MLTQNFGLELEVCVTFQWSFGVLLWELMTRGAVPYPNIENWNVSAHVVAGNILPQPNYCPNSV